MSRPFDSRTPVAVMGPGSTGRRGRLVVMRIVCCLANEAADVATWSGARSADIDTAMKLGTRYPIGPLACADVPGPSRGAAVLDHLRGHCGDVRYRRAPALSRAHFEPEALHG